MDLLINWIVVIISQNIHISKHHIVQFLEYIQFLFVKYPSIKLGGENVTHRKYWEIYFWIFWGYGLFCLVLLSRETSSLSQYLPRRWLTPAITWLCWEQSFNDTNIKNNVIAPYSGLNKVLITLKCNNL